MLTLLETSIIDKIMVEYKDALYAELRDNLKAVVLYGSCARGDYEIGSDIDVFVLVQNDKKETKEAIHRISHKFDLKYDTLIACTIRNVDFYTRYYQETLYQNIRREGRIFYGVA